ncbi:MAG TPA: DNA-binding domain-containing protein [Pyrinomonadaceae bacterium]|nr:DNA-binding domain-containing protein [Pyrinomonadaceae bacterium]
MSEQSLSLLMHWMQTVITERGGLGEKLDAAARRHELRAEDVVAERRGLSARERLAVYTGGYVLRLLECMRADFPVLCGFVGDSVFDTFAKAYVITMPPGSHSLYDLGADFSRFLEETKPKNWRLDAGISAMLDLPPELARLERARAEVLRAPGTEDDPPAAEPLSTFAVFGEELTLQATPCLRLLEMKFPLVDFLKSSDRGERPEPPAPRTSLVAVGRSNYRLHVEEISLWQFAFLRACERPTSSYSAVRVAALESGREPGQALAEVAMWLPVAFELGFLRRVV